MGFFKEIFEDITGKSNRPEIKGSRFEKFVSKTTAFNTSRVHSDNPISDARHFNFDAYADAISKIILNKDNKTPFTIAINGKWGSGKTTLMKTLRRKLDETSSMENNRKVKSVWFDAWKYSETDSMLAALVLEILEEMGRKDCLDGKKIDKWKVLTDIAKILSLGQAPDFDKWLKDPEYKEKLSFYDLFREYMKKILLTFVLDGKEREYDDKKGVLVIFIDDLDRCPPTKIVKVLESINLFFNQEGCFFVIGTDISFISRAIGLEYIDLGISGSDYIKKMIQLQFNLPTIREEEIKDFLSELEQPLERYFEMMIKGGLESNQREVKRFLNSLNFMRLLGASIPGLKYEDELLIKWGILNFSTENFIKKVNYYPKLMIIMQKISKKNEEDIKNYIETQNEPYKRLCEDFKNNEKILEVLKGGQQYTEKNISDYIFLSSVAPKQPGEVTVIEKQFKFDNYSSHIGVKKPETQYDWYEWKVFMDEPPEVLDKVSMVKYTLHYDFPNRIRTIDDKKSRFALSSAGWGTFWIDIIVYLKDGREIPRGYLLDFKKPWPESEPTMYDPKTVTLDELHRA